MDPFFDSLATALGGQAAAALGAAAHSAVEKVRGLLRRRKDEGTLAALEAAEAPDAGEPQIKALAERLDRSAAEDPEFDRELREAGAVVHREVSASGNRVVNQVSGNAQNVVQTNEIHGNINFG